MQRSIDTIEAINRSYGEAFDTTDPMVRAGARVDSSRVITDAESQLAKDANARYQAYVKSRDAVVLAADSYGSDQWPTSPPLPSFADMSSQQRSASMDNIARQVADLTAANNLLNSELAGTNLQLSRALDRIDRLERQHAACERRLDKDERAVAVKLSTFSARLRLLLTGR